MNSEKIYDVAIVGAGNIGAGFDRPQTQEVLTHAHAAVANPRTRLIGLVDTDAQKGESEAAKWDVPFFADIEGMVASTHPDIIVIATSDKTHVDVLERIVQQEPKLIVYEKPIATDKEELARVRRLVTDIPVIVNFRRRFDETVVRVAQALRNGSCGRVISASALYDRGIFHNGSHALDLARMFFGEVLTASPLGSVDDYPEGAAAVSGMAAFEHCPEFFLMHGDGRYFSVFEFDILTERKRLRFVEEGITLRSQEVVPDPYFKGFQTLGPAQEQKTGLISAMNALFSHAVRVLDGQELSRSTLESAIKTHEACQTFANFLEKA